MKFEKRNFMGIELDVLVGHPEHDILFIATQVARAAGLKNPSAAAYGYQVSEACSVNIRLGEIATNGDYIGSLPVSPNGCTYKSSTYIFDEPNVYRMLLRGHAPQSEPFRKWVTEEVLPSIRKTGTYKAEDSTNPIAVGIMDRLKSLEGVIVKQGEVLEALRQELQAKTFSLAAPVVPEISPYEGQAAVALCDPLGFNKRLYRELAESCLDRPAADKMEPRVV